MSNRVVMKFGGTSVGSSERIGAVARRVSQHIKKTGQQVVVVVSAMSGETDRLIEMGRKVSGGLSVSREYHQLVTAGEHASAALTAMALEREGLRAVSLLAHQMPIKTKSVYGLELIESIECQRIESLLAEGAVPVIAGFQGIDEAGDFSTLGRGGSDTTAVAIAAALGSCPCFILTDIDGVYSALPSVCRNARKLSKLTYEEMLELASGGAKILQARSVSLAYKFKVPLTVCSSFTEEEGTEIVEEYQEMEDAVVSGITCRADEAKITVRGLSDEPGVAARLFEILGEAEVVVDMIVQAKGSAGKASISFTVPQNSSQTAYDAILKMLNVEAPEASIELDKGIAKLAVVGEGMRTHAGVASKIFKVLGDEGINVDMITTSEIKISMAIQEKYSELAVRVLHDCFIEKPE